MDDVILEYRREGSLTVGRVFYSENGKECGELPFEKLSFSQMMVRFAEFVAQWPEAGAVMQRIDRAGIPPFRLDKETTQLLRSDPVTVIRSMTFPDNTTVSLKQRPAPQSLSPITIGYDVLAATLGDEVYCRMRADRLECPFCGVWAKVDHIERVHCPSRACGASISFMPHGDRWGGVLVTALLLSDKERFFLPRPWNKTKTAPWVARDALESLYKDWLRTKEQIK